MADYAFAIPPCGVSPGDGRRGSSMVEKRVDRSRREVMRAVVTGVPAGLLLRISPTEASEKMTRQQAEYQDAPKDIYSCGMCTLFEPPKYCKVVEGEVSKDGWCKAFVLAD
jgi:2,4-dienoyl-CoA reductase-like NADH-dependent reductase (Old Yellow Enzyme family)